ncbi:hypothetical protein [Xylocopilactobacillus apicola]|uniref:Tandem five-TM protein n=1 Tax=Xylocopilactobacillus apicola TaxID=2932184 RepID=A0AAU9DCY2_9LACO|nr:hypothetical protein [Xylocopilactobacillus apicola]BDR59410.1 hypothetical protein XA3_18510 [Xylocopilactobacillus apicola]
MVKNTHSSFSVKEYERIDIRYRLIHVKDKDYILDYSNPRDLRNYFMGTFYYKNSLQWKAYDVTHCREQIPVIKDYYKIEQRARLIEGVIGILYMINIFCFPKSLNISYLTYDPRIRSNWKLIIMILLVISLVLIFILASLKQYQLPVAKDEYLILKQTNYKELNAKDAAESKFYIRWFYKIPPFLQSLVAGVLFVMGIFIFGVIRSNFGDLIFFVIYMYCVIFLGRFLFFIPAHKNKKYTILEKGEL